MKILLPKEPKGTFKENLIEFVTIKWRDDRSALLFLGKLLESILLLVVFIFFLVIVGEHDIPLVGVYEILISVIGALVLTFFGYFFKTSPFAEIFLSFLITSIVILIVFF